MRIRHAARVTQLRIAVGAVGAMGVLDVLDVLVWLDVVVVLGCGTVIAIHRMERLH